ncbi:MAG: hypothetical protein HY912_24930 [Desulfomonile tiedjei]|uniref:Uncharacterized protein n=1 Tax=Desulfomonile tiedjei TaxID=2358 RepID=A0A9D6V725_9BACT|nr:hypothetical protein [Desulfomonile tiedjei]
MTTCDTSGSVGKVSRGDSCRKSFERLVGILVLVSGFSLGCQLVPSKPDAVFTLYRDRMKADNVVESRELLTDESRNLALELASQYKLDQPPESLALLNALDPTAIPTVMQSEDTLALLQTRTLKGSLRVIRMVRKDAGASWKLDMAEELKSLKAFLVARVALEMMKDQAGEYAASWKAFNDQLKKINPIETEPPKLSAPKPPPSKPVKKQKPKKDNSR